MTLKKTIASYLKADGTWEPQRDLDMHPLEEASVRAYWHIDDVAKKALPIPSREQEHEWLIEQGAEFVKQKREEFIKSREAVTPELIQAEDKFKETTKAWCDHVELCCAHKLDPNTFDGDAREKLAKKEIENA